MKKMISILLVVLLLASLLVGCGGSGGSDNSRTGKKDTRECSEIDSKVEPAAYLAAYMRVDEGLDDVDYNSNTISFEVGQNGEVTVKERLSLWTAVQVVNITVSDDEELDGTYSASIIYSDRLNKESLTAKGSGKLNPEEVTREWKPTFEEVGGSLYDEGVVLLVGTKPTAEELADATAYTFLLALDGLNAYLNDHDIPITMADLGYTYYITESDAMKQEQQMIADESYTEEALGQMTSEEAQQVHEVYKLVLQDGEVYGNTQTVYTKDEEGHILSLESKSDGLGENGSFVPDEYKEYEYGEGGELLKESRYYSLTSAEDSLPKQEVCYAYDDQGNVISKESMYPYQEDEERDLLEMTYDENNLVSTMHYESYDTTGELEYVINVECEGGRIVHAQRYLEPESADLEAMGESDDACSIEYEYDDQGRVTKWNIQCNEEQGEIICSYDENGICTILYETIPDAFYDYYLDLTGKSLLMVSEERVDPNGHLLYQKMYNMEFQYYYQ